MTFNDDFLIFFSPGGEQHRVPCNQLGISWPPPATIRLRGFEPPFEDINFHQVSCSSMSDLERSVRSDVARGARYAWGGMVQ